MQVCVADYLRMTAISADANVVCVFPAASHSPNQHTHRAASLAEFEAPDVYAPDLDPCGTCMFEHSCIQHTLTYTHT